MPPELAAAAWQMLAGRITDANPAHAGEIQVRFAAGPRGRLASTWNTPSNAWCKPRRRSTASSSRAAAGA